MIQLLFLKHKRLPMYCLACFPPFILSTAYGVFFPSCPQIAEAGTKGDMIYLDAPDA